MWILLVLRIAPNSLAGAHSHIAVSCWVYFPWVPFPAPCGCPQSQGALLEQFCCPTFVSAASGALGSSAGLIPCLAYRQDKGAAAGAVWEHLVCAPDVNSSVKQSLPSPGFSLCCLEGLEKADLGRPGEKWAGFGIQTRGVFCLELYRHPSGTQCLMGHSEMAFKQKFSFGEVSLWALFFSHLHPPFWGVTLLVNSLESF